MQLVDTVGAVGSESMGTIRLQYLRAWQRLSARAEMVDDSRWEAPSPCAGWSDQLVGHTIDAAHQTRLSMVGILPRHR